MERMRRVMKDIVKIEGQELALPDLGTGVILPTLQHILKPPILTNLCKTVDIFGGK